MLQQSMETYIGRSILKDVKTVLTMTLVLFSWISLPSKPARGEETTWLVAGSDLSSFESELDAGDDPTYGAQSVAEPTTFKTGDAMRIYDNNAGDKPELQGETVSPLNGPFRVDFQTFNQSTPADGNAKSAIRFRMGNSGKDVGSETRAAFTVSWQVDGVVTAKHAGGTKNSKPLIVPHSITIIGNASTSSEYSYTLFGQSRTLHATSYDVYVDGQLLNNDDNQTRGLSFTSPDEFDPTLGLRRFGLVGSSNQDIGADYLFDNVALRTDGDILNQ